MRKKHLLTLCVAGMLFAGCSNFEQEANYRIVPIPQEITLDTSKQPFKLTKSTVITYPTDNDSLKNEAEFLSEYIQNLTGHALKIKQGELADNAINLNSKLSNANSEAYTIEVTPSAININGASNAGTFYGIQTLRKSIPEAKKSQDILFPAAIISDQPRFGYRGAHLDVARHFFDVDSVKSYIDMLALHNMNTFHWHLTDDQGWRIEIKSHPELTEIGSKRKGTVIGHNSGVYDSIPYDGYFTQEQAREIVDYASKRHITVIPEIDMPGHMLGALTAYPNLGCTGGPYDVWQIWGVSPDVLCAGNDSTYMLIKDVLGEIADIFPSEYVHIGGDECPKIRWHECEKCQAKIRELGLKTDAHSTKEEKLQSYVINFASNFLTSRGKKIIGWDEILEGGLAPGAVVMSWRGESGGIEAARQNHEVIMTPNTYLYFDYYQTLDRENEPDAIGGYLPIERVYSYEPYSKHLSDEQNSLIKGVQANLWTEYMPTFSQVQYMALPRMAALSEIQWSQADKKNFEDFASRLPQIINHYDANGYNYATHVFNIKGSLEADTLNNTIIATLTTFDNAPIYYTTDGTMPTEKSMTYNAPIVLDSSTVLKAIALRNSKPSKLFADSVTFSKSTAHPITILNQPHSSYRASGAATLVDGKLGPKGFNNGFWMGFYGADLVAVINLQKDVEVSKVSVRCCVTTGDWIFDARGIIVEVSNDGATFTEVANESYPQMTGQVDEIITHSLKFNPVNARYVKVTAITEKTIPDWHGGAGNNGFLFVDEITVD